MEDFENNYHKQSKTVIADAGYGSDQNYEFMEDSHIEAFVKYNYFHKEQKRAGKNALKFAYLRKAVLFLESEIELLKLTFPLSVNRLPDSSQSNNPKVYFIPKSQGLGIDSVGEIAVSFELSGQFFDEQRNPAPFIHIAHALEQAFNFNFGDIYKSKARVFSRKPFNLTKALDYLRNLIVRESHKKKMGKDNFANR